VGFAAQPTALLSRGSAVAEAAAQAEIEEGCESRGQNPQEKIPKTNRKDLANLTWYPAKLQAFE